ncbi:hypothetical protein M2437_000769 [Methylorubrum pseudosasae]|nr:hypothetical protein [Methylorubrum pseudosasae]
MPSAATRRGLRPAAGEPSKKFSEARPAELAESSVLAAVVRAFWSVRERFAVVSSGVAPMAKAVAESAPAVAAAVRVIDLVVPSCMPSLSVIVSPGAGLLPTVRVAVAAWPLLKSAATPGGVALCTLAMSAPPSARFRFAAVSSLVAPMEKAPAALPASPARAVRSRVVWLPSASCTTTRT